MGAFTGAPELQPVGAASRFAHAAGITWHVQTAGRGPVLLLLHGTGSAGSSWRDLVPLLAADFTVVAPDLPGHGLSARVASGPASLPVIAHALASLMRALELPPEFICGHSAGAAISAQMALAETPGVRRLAWIAPAMRPFDGIAGAVASPLARVLSQSPWLARLAAWRAGSDAAVRRLIASTGSTLDAHGIATYGALLRQPGHVAGALAMMAGWELAPLQRALRGIGAPVLLLHGAGDRTVPARQSEELATRLQSARVQHLPDTGHLAHEEQPAHVAGLLRAWFVAAR